METDEAKSALKEGGPADSPNRVLVCGSRLWADRVAVARRLAQLPRDTVIIHGGARGADTIAGYTARAFDLTVEEYPADWKRNGKAAGPIRNQRMLTEGRPSIVIAFHEDPRLGRGTADMVRRAKAAGLPIEIHDASGNVSRTAPAHVPLPKPSKEDPR